MPEVSWMFAAFGGLGQEFAKAFEHAYARIGQMVNRTLVKVPGSLYQDHVSSISRIEAGQPYN